MNSNMMLEVSKFFQIIQAKEFEFQNLKFRMPFKSFSVDFIVSQLH